MSSVPVKDRLVAGPTSTHQIRMTVNDRQGWDPAVQQCEVIFATPQQS